MHLRLFIVIFIHSLFIDIPFAYLFLAEMFLRNKLVQIRSFFWSTFSRVRPEYGPEKNSVFGHFSRSVRLITIRTNQQKLFVTFKRRLVNGMSKHHQRLRDNTLISCMQCVWYYMVTLIFVRFQNFCLYKLSKLNLLLLKNAT